MTKPKLSKTLSDSDIAWVKKQKAFPLPGVPQTPLPEKGLSKKQQQARKRQKFFKVREIVLKEISDLTLLAEFLPEDQLKQIFTEEQLLPLFNAIFLGYKSLLELDEDGNVKLVNPAEKLPMNEELLKKRRKRLLPLCSQIIIGILDDTYFSTFLAGPELNTVTGLDSRLLPGLRAIYYRSMIPEEKKTKTTGGESPRAR